MFMIFNAHVLEQTAVLLVSSQAVLFVNRVTITLSFYTSIAGQKEGEKRGRRERVREREREGRSILLHPDFFRTLFKFDLSVCACRFP